MATILGAGLSGLIAATQMPNSTLIEAGTKEALSHRAVLRFRSDVLSRLTGIPFRKVTVRKSIWNEVHCAPNIQLANLYSRKTNGRILDRSIWQLDPVERFIAPEDLTEQLIDSIDGRVRWETRCTQSMLADLPRPIVSTIPMPVLLELIGAKSPEDFSYESITVDRYRVKGADVFQTIYYPSQRMAAYRASITGDLLIIESTSLARSHTSSEWMIELAMICESFGLAMNDLTLLQANHVQRFGKIAPINDHWRRQFIFDTSHQLGIYSLGRFAVWRNILLDDVAHDTAVIKRLIQQGAYSAALHNSARAATVN